jgi:hypothetical protein
MSITTYSGHSLSSDNHGLSAPSEGHAPIDAENPVIVSKSSPDTVGELRRAEVCVSCMPSLKAKKLEMLTQEKVVLER